jgi:hypothetical protein
MVQQGCSMGCLLNVVRVSMCGASFWAHPGLTENRPSNEQTHSESNPMFG